MLKKLLFVLLLSFFNASEPIYKNYIKANFTEKSSSNFIPYALASMGSIFGLNPTTFGISVGAIFLGKYIARLNTDVFKIEWEKELFELTKNEIDKLKILLEDFSKKYEEIDEKIYKDEINELNSIFEKEKKEIVNEHIIDFVSSNIIEKNLENIKSLNILCLGKSQIGKTTLINEILFLDKDKKGKTGGEGKSITMKDTPYISNKLKHIKIIDSRGMESGNFSLKNFTERYQKKMLENTKYGNYSDLIHCIWYCVSGNLMNNEEIDAIKQINSLFNKYKVPIIFVYLKPFNYNDIKILRNVTSEINNNFIAVQSIHYIDECEKGDINCFKPRQEYEQKNMDVLIEMTKNLALDGIKNATSSRSSFYLIEKIEKTLETRFEKKSDEFVNFLNSIENSLKNKTFNIDLKMIDDVREKNILKIIEIIEESLFNSKRKISKEVKELIYYIQEKIENLYQQKISNIYKEYLLNFYSKIEEKKKLLYDKFDEESLLGCNNLEEKDLDDDLERVEKFFDSNYIIQIYSMLASFETINKKLKNQILSLLKSRIDKIISDNNLLEILELKIKLEAEKGTKNLINSLNYEIKKNFQK